MKNVLIIGNGYIGENAAKYLAVHYPVTVYSRSRTYQHSGIDYVYGEIESLPMLLRDREFDIVINAFGCSRLHSFDRYSDYCNTNVYLFSKILDYVADIGAKLIYPATSLCLSDQDQSFYSFSHQIAVDMIKRYHIWYDVQYEICYIHNVYGTMTKSPKRHKMLIDVLLDAYQSGNAMTVFNGGNQKRVFTHIEDVTRYLKLAIESEACNEVNLVNEYHEYSVIELVNLFRIETIDQQNDSYTDHTPCIERLGNLHGWIETIDVREWLKQFVR